MKNFKSLALVALFAVSSSVFAADTAAGAEATKAAPACTSCLFTRAKDCAVRGANSLKANAAKFYNFATANKKRKVVSAVVAATAGFVAYKYFSADEKCCKSNRCN